MKKFKVSHGPTIEALSASLFDMKDITIMTDRGTYTGRAVTVTRENSEDFTVILRLFDGTKLKMVYSTSRLKGEGVIMDE